MTTTTVQLPSEAEFLDMMADLLETTGITKSGDYYERKDDGTTCYCVVGAAMHLSGEIRDKMDDKLFWDLTWDLQDRATALFREYVHGVTGRPNIPAYNDDPQRPEAEIIADIRLVAQRAREAAK